MSALFKVMKCLPHIRGLLTELPSVKNIVSTRVQFSGIMGPMLQTEELNMKLLCETKVYGYSIIYIVMLLVTYVSCSP
jgi:hypothetical protein